MIGFSVADTSNFGDGFPDIVVGAHGKNFLFEIKNPHAERGRKQAMKLTPDEDEFHKTWKGQVTIVTTVTEILKVISEQTK